MPEPISIRANTSEFTNTLREYMNWTKKDLAEVINTKAFFITLKALKYTPTASANAIRREMTRKVVAHRMIRKLGQTAIYVRGKKMVPRLALIINARRRFRGKKGLYGKEMIAEFTKILNARIASRSFEKAGWVWSLKKLAPFVPSASRYAQQHDIRIGTRPVGDATGATPGFSPTAEILNRAWPTRSRKAANSARLVSKMTNALQQAINEEAASMVQYIERKMQDRANNYQHEKR